jgi:hypothetical protein
MCFNFRLVDDKGNNLVCIPKSIFLLCQFIYLKQKITPFSVLKFGIRKKKLRVFKSLKGLEKNKLLKNAVGVISDIKTPKQLVPGKSEDTLEIRIFQGEDNAEGKDSFLSDHVTSVIITGDDVEKVNPC